MEIATSKTGNGHEELLKIPSSPVGKTFNKMMNEMV